MPALPPVKRYVSRSGVRVYRIACQVLPDLYGRVYLLLGAGPPTLVDAGSGEGPCTRQVLDGLQSVRSEFAEPVRPQDIRRILITHGHFDHFGGVPDLARLSGAEVAIHALDRRMLTATEERAALARRAIADFLARAGAEPPRRAELLRSFPQTRPRPSVAVDFALEDGMELDGLEVLHTPGHSPGHVCLRAGEILLAGDHILARTIPQQWPESVAAYTGLGHFLESLDKVARLQGVEMILGGHEPPVQGVAQRIREIRVIQERRLDRLMDLLAAAGEPLSIVEISDRIYPRQEGYHALLAILDVGARVEHLDQRGRLAVDNLEEIQRAERPVFRYRPA